jgi:transcription antitermination factor NusG
MLVQPTDPRLLWYLLRTKLKQERAVVETLSARGVEGYCPRVLEPRWHARAPRGPMPLFPSYVFARFLAAESFAAVNYCTGAAGVVRFGTALAAVEDAVVAELREREGERGYVEFKAVREKPREGERARIERGPLAGLEGVVTRYLPARDRVRLLLALVGGARNVEVDARHVRSVQQLGAGRTARRRVATPGGGSER